MPEELSVFQGRESLVVRAEHWLLFSFPVAEISQAGGVEGEEGFANLVPTLLPGGNRRFQLRVLLVRPV